MRRFVLLFFLSFFVSACCDSPYNYETIAVDGQQISCTCTAWQDGCHVYCRQGVVGYTRFIIDDKIKCTNKDLLNTFKCIDEEPDLLKICSECAKAEDKRDPSVKCIPAN